MTYDPYEIDCKECGGRLDVRRAVIWTQVVGWERPRTQGGTNHLALRRPQDRHMCDDCMRLALRGIHPAQPTLWDVAEL